MCSLEDINVCLQSAFADWPDLLNHNDAVWLSLKCLLNSPFRFRPTKSLVPSGSTPDSYFTSSNNILRLYHKFTWHLDRERKKRKRYETEPTFSPPFSCNARISIACLPGSARVNVHSSQGRAPSKTSDLNFQPDVTSSTPWTITKTRLWPHTNLSERSPAPSSSTQSQKRRWHWGFFLFFSI